MPRPTFDRYAASDGLWRCPHVHHFRLTRPTDIDTTFLGWLREAYAVGEQRHLRDRPD